MDPTDVIVVPIGAYNPWIASHCTPEQAVEMADAADGKAEPLEFADSRLGR